MTGSTERHEFVPADVCAVCVQPAGAEIHTVPSDAAVVGVDVTMLARDLAAFKDVPVDQALAALEAEFAGGGVLPPAPVSPAPRRGQTDSQRVMNRARNLAAKYVREHHHDVWEVLVDQAANELGIDRQAVR